MSPFKNEKPVFYIIAAEELNAFLSLYVAVRKELLVLKTIHHSCIHDLINDKRITSFDIWKDNDLLCFR